MTNWKLLDSELKTGLDAFAVGIVSAREARELARKRGAKVFTEFDRLLRDYGVTEARQLARKALRRRGIAV
jgi:hypothetical protein